LKDLPSPIILLLFYSKSFFPFLTILFYFFFSAFSDVGNITFLKVETVDFHNNITERSWGPVQQWRRSQVGIVTRGSRYPWDPHENV